MDYSQLSHQWAAVRLNREPHPDIAPDEYMERFARKADAQRVIKQRGIEEYRPLIAPDDPKRNAFLTALRDMEQRVGREKAEELLLLPYVLTVIINRSATKLTDALAAAREPRFKKECRELRGIIEQEERREHATFLPEVKREADRIVEGILADLALDFLRLHFPIRNHITRLHPELPRALEELTTTAMELQYVTMAVIHVMKSRYIPVIEKIRGHELQVSRSVCRVLQIAQAVKDHYAPRIGTKIDNICGRGIKVIENNLKTLEINLRPSL